MSVTAFGASVATVESALRAPFGDAPCALGKHAAMNDFVLAASVVYGQYG